MYPGAHSRKDSKPRFPTNRAAVLLLSMILLIGIAVGTTVAFLVARTEPIKSTFEYAKVSCEVTGSKENVQIKNTGNTAAYIRATYVVTWRDGNRNVAVSVPDGYSYTLTENLGNNWKKRHGRIFLLFAAGFPRQFNRRASSGLCGYIPGKSGIYAFR